jgi:acyl carrier protein
VGLAEKLGLTAPEPEPVLPVEAAPRGPTETRLAVIWRRVLRRAQVGRRDRFLDLGGDSLLATQLVARVADEFTLDLSLVDFFDAPTIAEQAALLELLRPPASMPEPSTEHISGSL